jgi:hypothetical protein
MERMPPPVMSPKAWRGALASVFVLLTACGTGPTVATGSPPRTVHVTTSPPRVPGSGSCSNLSSRHDDKHGIEVEGKTTDQEPLTVLFAGVDHRIPAGSALQTYVRVGGVRALRMSVIDAEGHVDRALGFRPGLPRFAWPGAGTPWEGSLRFPQPGCWRVYVQRGGLTGELWLHAG